MTSYESLLNFLNTYDVSSLDGIENVATSEIKKQLADMFKDVKNTETILSKSYDLEIEIICLYVLKKFDINKVIKTLVLTKLAEKSLENVIKLNRESTQKKYGDETYNFMLDQEEEPKKKLKQQNRHFSFDADHIHNAEVDLSKDEFFDIQYYQFLGLSDDDLIKKYNHAKVNQFYNKQSSFMSLYPEETFAIMTKFCKHQSFEEMTQCSVNKNDSDH